MGEVFLNKYTLAVSYHAFNFHVAEVRFLLPLKKFSCITNKVESQILLNN